MKWVEPEKSRQRGPLYSAVVIELARVGGVGVHNKVS